MNREEKLLILATANGLISSLYFFQNFLHNDFAEYIKDEPDSPCGELVMKSIRNDFQTLLYMRPLLVAIEDDDLPGKTYVEFIDDNRKRIEELIIDILEDDFTFEDHIDKNLLKIK